MPSNCGIASLHKLVLEFYLALYLLLLVFLSLFFFLESIALERL